MLVLNRRPGEQVYVGEDIVITVCATYRGHVRLGISAPSNVRIIRQEIREEPLHEESPSHCEVTT